MDSRMFHTFRFWHAVKFQTSWLILSGMSSYYSLQSDFSHTFFIFLYSCLKPSGFGKIHLFFRQDIAKAGPEDSVLLPTIPEYWGYNHTRPHSALGNFFCCSKTFD